MKEIFVSPQFWSIMIPALLAIWIFAKTKDAERESEWRKEKLKLYLNFVQSLTGITEAYITDQGGVEFAKACNDLHALAPRDVLVALHKYQDEIRITNPNPSDEKKQIALNNLLFEMRKDLKIKPKDNQNEFHIVLWASSKKENDL